MKWIFRVGVAAVVALTGLSADAANFVEEEVRLVDLVTKGLTGDAARNEFVKACEAAMNGSKDKAQIILVEGDLNISYGDKAHTALNKLFNQNRKIALLCNSPDFKSMGKTFWKLSDDDFRLAHEVVIDGGSRGRCLTIDSKKSSSTSSVAGNNVGLIYGVKFKNAVSGFGGAVDARGSVRFVNCTFQDCKATSTADLNGGGAIYYPPHSDWLTYAFCPRRLSDKDGMEMDEMSKASCSLCTFRNCTAKNNGGAIYTNGASKYGVIKDCVFDQCEADGWGGALYNVEKVERSIFRTCKAKKQGGAIYYVDIVQTSLFADTSASKCGALGKVEGAYACTFVNCAATDSKEHYVMPTKTKVGSSIVVGTDDAYMTYQVVFANYSKGTAEAEALFLNYNGGDFHLKPEKAEGVRVADSVGFGYDLDRKRYNEPLTATNVTPRTIVAGCYRYNTKEEIEEQKKNLDIAILNPLIVTTTMDVVDPIDGRISFREACSNLMAHVEPPRGMADQWPRITFELPSSSRYIDIQGETPFEISDALRTNPERLGKDNLSKYTPIVIDGGVKGLTIHGGDGNSSVVLKLSSAARLINVNFENAPVEMGDSRAKWGGFDAKFCVTNCAFTGGGAALPFVRTDAAGHAFEFTRCSFVNAGSATSAVRFDQSANFSASFTCCTFAGFDQGDGTVMMPAADGDLSFGSCTFARNGAADNAAFADIWVGDGVNGGSIHLGDCLFADGRDRALRCPETFKVYGKIETDDGSTPPDKMMENFAGSAANALDSTAPVRTMVAGIGHTAFQPKHGGPARRGCRTIFFDDKTIYEQPKTDIFGFPQEGERTSLGSRYVDDVETKSVTVDLKEDVSDPYDDRISFREAIAYGLSDYRAFGKGGYLTPLFATKLVEDGVVEIGLESAIALTDCKAFENGYTVWIKPGTDQRLKLHTSDMGGGLFRQAANTRVRFDDVLFSDCCNYDGSGGVLDSAGWTRFNRCRFQNCFASEVKIIPAARALAAAYAPVFDTLDLSDGRGREVVLKSIPPSYRERFVDAEETLVTALATCTNTIGILRQSGLTISNRLVKASAYLDDFMEATRDVAETFNIFCLYAPTIVMRLNAEGIYVNADRFAASLAEAEAAMKTFEGLREKLKAEGLAVAGSGGALNLRETAACIVYDATADGCVTLGPGGFLANAGDFKGVNLTLTGNSAIDGGCIANLGGTNQLVSVAIAENFSETNGVVSVTGGALGLLNSIVVANRGGSVTCVAPETLKTVSSLVDSKETPINLAEVFSTSAPAEHQVSNGVDQLYYPLRFDGRASHTGTFVFFNADTEKSQADGIESTWIKGVCHTTDPDGFTPKPELLFGSGSVHWNAGLYYDLLGKVIRVWEDPRTFTGAIPASMGPVPNVPSELKGSVVTTAEDDENAADNLTSLREAAAYAMASNTTVVFDANLVAGGAVFELSNQIVVPPGKTLRISANPGEVTLKPSRTFGNRFFRVERGGRLELRGIVMDGGYAKGKYEVGTGPADDDDGGAICSEGTLELADCTIRNCRANGFGGAVWSGGGMTARDCTFAGNFAQRGGGLCSDDEPLRLSGVILTGNTAQDYGGGLYLVAGTNDAVATGLSITGNAANGETVQGGPNFGGGVYVTPNGSVPPGEVTIVGTISDNEGGDEYRLDKRGAETSEKGGVPFQPIPRLMSARLAAAPNAAERIISSDTTLEVLELGDEFGAPQQVRVTNGACLTLTGGATDGGAVLVSARMFDDGVLQRVTIENGATIKTSNGFYRSPGDPYAELVVDGGTAELSGGDRDWPFGGDERGSSGTITLRNGATFTAAMDVTLNSGKCVNTVSNSVVACRSKQLTVTNGARLKMVDSSLEARTLTIGDRGAVLLQNATTELATAVNARAAAVDGDALVVTGGMFTATTLFAGAGGQKIRFDDVDCEIDRIALNASDITFSGNGPISIGRVSVDNDPTSGSGSLTFDNAAASVETVDVVPEALSVELAFRGTNACLDCRGSFTFGGTLRFEIPREGWSEPPLRIGQTASFPDGFAFGISSGNWIKSWVVKVPLVGFASRPSFLTDEWLASATARDLPKNCALKYDAESQVLLIEYEFDRSAYVCDVVRDGTTNQFALVEDALAFAQPRETVTLWSETQCDSLRIRDFITLDLNGFALLSSDTKDRKLPAIEENTGVLVAYGLLEVDALMGDRFKGTMRFGQDVTWEASPSESITFKKGTDVTVGNDSTNVYMVTTAFSDTYGLNKGWSVTVYGPAELGGSNYDDCTVEVFEDATIVTPLVLDGATLAVSGTVSFAEDAYIDLRSVTNGGVCTRTPIDYCHFRITDPAVAAGADVTCTQLDGGVLWYHLSDDPEVLSRVAEVDGLRYTLKEAFAVANENGHAVTLLRDDDGEDAGTIPVGRDIAFDMTGKRIRAKDGTGLTFAVSNGCLAVTGGCSATNHNVRFELLHGDALDGGLHLAGGVFGMAGQPVVTVANGCTNAVVALTEGAQLLPSTSCTSPMFVKLDGFADCLFDAAKVGGEGVAHAIIHHSARIAVTNGAELVSKDETILQTLALGSVPYDFTLEMSDANSIIRTVKGPSCVASQLDEAGIGSATVANRFVCRSGDFECPTNGANAAVRFFGDVGYDVTGGRFGGAEKPVVSSGFVAVEDPVSQRDLYWEVIRPGQEGVYVAKIGREKYESLEEAFSVVQPGGTVTMIADASPLLTLAIDMPVTLDLNGCTIASKSGPFGDIFTVGKEGELTILDSGGNGGVGVVNPPGSAVQYRDITVHGTLKVYGGTFSSCRIIGDGTLDFRGGNFIKTRISGKDSKTTLVIRNGVFGHGDSPFQVFVDNFASIAVSGGEFYNSTGAPFVHSRVDHPVQFLSGGTFNSPWDKKMDDSYCAAGYAYEKLLVDRYRVAQPDIAEVIGGKKYDTLEEAFDNVPEGGTVRLLKDYEARRDSVYVEKSFTFLLNGYSLKAPTTGPFTLVKIYIEKNAAFVVNGLSANAVCSNIYFYVGYGTSGSIHLVGGRYYGDGRIVYVYDGQCVIDQGALLESTSYWLQPAVSIEKGTLAMSNAVIRSEKDGIEAENKNGGDVFLRIGGGAIVESAGAPLYLSGDCIVNLDISGDCKFRSVTDKHAPVEIGDRVGFASTQKGIWGGRFYGVESLPLDNRLLATGYSWERFEDDSGSGWRPVGNTPEPPAESTIRIVGGRVYSGQYDITDAVTIRGDGTVELKAGGVVGGVKVTPVIGDLPPSSDGEGGTATPPFTVGPDGAALTLETIPGLCYGLLRGETPDKVDEVVDWGWAESGTMTLKDIEAPKDGAFYRIVVKIEEF